MKLRVALVITLSLSGCNKIADWADNNMPVIGERCYNWQCITEGGQGASRAKSGESEAPQLTQEELDAAFESGAGPTPLLAPTAAPAEPEAERKRFGDTPAPAAPKQ